MIDASALRLKQFVRDDPIRWSRLRPVGNSPIVRASILVPVCGYLLIFNEYLRQYLALWFELSVPWRLYCLYYGLCLVGVASLAFAYFCPGTVRKYPSAVEYTLAESRFFESDTHFSYLDARVREEFEALSHFRQYASGIFENRKLGAGITKANIIPAMTLLWHIMDTHRPPIRYLTGLLYAAGFVLIAIPSIATFVGVTTALLRR
jgi:hypothetical protein